MHTYDMLQLFTAKYSEYPVFENILSHIELSYSRKHIGPLVTWTMDNGHERYPTWSIFT